MATYYGYDARAKRYYALPETPDGQPEPSAEASQPSAPGAIPHVKLTAELTNTADLFATQQLLATTLKDGVYCCPKCSYTNTEREPFMKHMTEEINKTLTQLAQLTMKVPPPKEKLTK